MVIVCHLRGLKVLTSVNYVLLSEYFRLFKSGGRKVVVFKVGIVLHGISSLTLYIGDG